MILKFYSLLIHLYGLLIRVVALKLPQAKLWVKGREAWRTKYAAVLKDNQQAIWFHCASLGEFEQGRPLIEKIRSDFPNKKIVLSFFSPSGYEIRKDYNQVDAVIYLPLDTFRNANDFIELLNPSMALFVKYEFWFNYLSVLDQKQIPIVYFSTIFRANHFLLKWPGNSLLPLIARCQKIFVQDEDSLKRLVAVGLNNVSQASDTRFDRVWNTAMHAVDDSVIKEFAQNRKLLMLGSAWLPDIEALREVLPTFDFKQWCIAIAPHHIDEVSLEELMCQLGLEEAKQYYTDFDKSKSTNILVINTMGRLSSLYKMADLVFVGGGFGKAVHNVLEPAVFAKPIVCGPRIQKFKEVLDLNSEKGIVVIPETSDFKGVWNTLSQNENLCKKMGETNFLYVKSRLGGADTIFNYLRTFF